jgi:hypothetical protein
MSESQPSLKKAVLNETALFLALFLFGILILPIAIYLVGQAVFGAYGGAGFFDFYDQLHYELRTGRAVTWYLVLSPYLGWQLLRLTFLCFRVSRRRPSTPVHHN